MPKTPLSKTQEKCRKIRMKKKQGRSAFFNLSVLGIACVLGIVYLIQTNFIATEGYKIDDLKNQISKIEAKNRQLEVNALEFQSMFNIGDKIVELNMIDGSQAAHIDRASSIVAVR
ncbi:MAG: hypothetical protein ABIC82_03885 [bacterium]